MCPFNTFFFFPRTIFWCMSCVECFSYSKFLNLCISLEQIWKLYRFTKWQNNNSISKSDEEKNKRQLKELEWEKRSSVYKKKKKEVKKKIQSANSSLQQKQSIDRNNKPTTQEFGSNIFDSLKSYTVMCN